MNYVKKNPKMLLSVLVTNYSSRIALMNVKESLYFKKGSFDHCWCVRTRQIFRELAILTLISTTFMFKN